MGKFLSSHATLHAQHDAKKSPAQIEMDRFGTAPTRGRNDRRFQGPESQKYVLLSPHRGRADVPLVAARGSASSCHAHGQRRPHLRAARRLRRVEWAATRIRAAWRSLRGPNRYVLRLPVAAAQWARRTARKLRRRDTDEQKKLRTVRRHHPGDAGSRALAARPAEGPPGADGGAVAGRNGGPANVATSVAVAKPPAHAG